MKIIFLCEYYPPMAMGGAEISIERLVNSIKEEHEVFVVTPNYLEYKDDIEYKDGLTIFKFKSFRSFIYKKGSGSSQDAYVKNKVKFYAMQAVYQRLSSWDLAHNLKRAIKQWHPDIIVANNIESSIALSYVNNKIVKFGYFRDLALLCPGYRTCGEQYCGNCSITGVSKCLGMNKLVAFCVKKFIIDYRKKRMKKIPNFLCINEYMQANILVEGYKGRTNVLRDPISGDIVCSLSKEQVRERLGLDLKKTIFLFVGSLTRVKGAHLLNEVLDFMGDSVLVVVGDGPLRNTVIDKRAIFTGKLSQNELCQYYRACDVLLSLSRVNYGCGMVQVEAMANQTLFASFNIKGIDEEVINEQTGITASTVRDLLLKIHYYLVYKNVYKQIILNANKMVKKHEINEIKKEFNKIILEAKK